MTIEQKHHYKNMRDIFIWGYFISFWIFSGLLGMADLPYALIILIALAIFGADVVGCYYWAKYKGRSYWFISMALFGWIGWAVLMILKDKNIP